MLLQQRHPEKEIDLEDLEEKLETEIRQKEQKLSQLSSNSASNSSVSNNRSTLVFEESLWNIDFDRPKLLARQSTDRLSESGGGSALFLIERCLEMEGHLLLKSIRSMLESHTRQFLEYPVEFVPTMPAIELAFLKILGGHFGLIFNETTINNTDQELLVLVEEVVSVISRLLRSGTTVFIPLTNWQSLGTDYQVHFLDWFMNTFWKALTSAISQVMVDYSPKVFFIILADSPLAEACRKKEYFCNIESFDSRKLLNLPVTPWCRSDVSLWLDNYSSKLTKPKRDRFVNSIFNEKPEELPFKIRIALEKAHAKSLF